MKTRTKKILALGLVLILVMAGGGFAAYKGYRSVRHARLIKQAKAFLAKPDDRKALLCVKRALAYNSRDVEACRMMAQLAERAGSRDAVFWRNRVVEYKTNSTDDQLALAQTALAFRDYATATNALEAVSAAGKKTAAYQNIAGAVATAINDLKDAEAHFAEAIRLEPSNAAPQLNLAIVRLHGTNQASMAEARTTLSRLSTNPTNATLRCQALRELIVDATRFKRSQEALSLSDSLLQQTNSVFRDRILRLEVLKQSNNPGFKPALAQYQKEAGTNGAMISDLGSWQMANSSPQETLAWLQTLPVETRTNSTDRPLGGRMSDLSERVARYANIPPETELGCSRHLRTHSSLAHSEARTWVRRRRGMGTRPEGDQRFQGGEQPVRWFQNTAPPRRGVEMGKRSRRPLVEDGEYLPRGQIRSGASNAGPLFRRTHEAPHDAL